MDQLKNSHWLVFSDRHSESVYHVAQTNKPNYFSFQKSVTFKKYASCLAFQNPVYLSNQYEIDCQSHSESSASHQNLLASNHTFTIYLCSPPVKCFYYQLAQCKKKKCSFLLLSMNHYIDDSGIICFLKKNHKCHLAQYTFLLWYFFTEQENASPSCNQRTSNIFKTNKNMNFEF